MIYSVFHFQLHDALAGCYDDVVDQVTVIDCRYPYEYDGGHIKVKTCSKVKTFNMILNAKTNALNHDIPKAELN